MNKNLWNSVAVTNPNFVKSFTRGGGFSGTAINATYQAQKATETFGPCGIGWGIDILEERYQDGAPLIQDGTVVGKEVIHVLRVKLWYVYQGKRGEVIHFGQTPFVGSNKNGFFTDEEAPKKSMTDAMSKCLSLIGFSADVHLGLYDDNKYVADLRKEFGTDKNAKSESTPEGKREEAGKTGGNTLTPIQAKEVVDLLTASKRTPESLLAWLKSKAKTVEELTLPEYERAISVLKQREAA
ncbi:MAG: hypothetical protein Q8M09_11280 [Pseudomonadota bacterium]|nr:hypothetical protein [Pseudomonadota bacterium]MDP2352679.1 hypothetical protein [Pseudomonadota bacterium]